MPFLEKISYTYLGGRKKNINNPINKTCKRYFRKYKHFSICKTGCNFQVFVFLHSEGFNTIAIIFIEINQSLDFGIFICFGYSRFKIVNSPLFTRLFSCFLIPCTASKFSFLFVSKKLILVCLNASSLTASIFHFKFFQFLL